eukprot:TRINITY_DN4191_c0_g1_i2.p1 TRINITY_DN4191_c0_g1~~TRINITY_DN4191_c0_g1_i2.p1  ORF type:complete len:624 (-),score=101.20 TRINITY_DN4191_c0_g1_i2:77-1783(-)
MVRGAGYPEAADKLYADQVDGEALALLSVSDFVEYGVKKGPALKLVHQLQLLSSADANAVTAQAAQAQAAQAAQAQAQAQALAQPHAALALAAPIEHQVSMQDLINAFVINWNLDSHAHSTLLTLDLGSQDRAIRTFSPPPNTTNTSVAFLNWVREQMAAGLIAQAADALVQAIDPNAAALIHEFVTKWGLDSKAQDMLYRLDAATMYKVITEFAPTDETRANPMFMGFVKSVASRIANESLNAGLQVAPAIVAPGDPISDFVTQWGLDSKSVEVLLSLDPVMQQRVMQGFAPPNPLRANQMFMGFVKSVVQRSGGSMTPAPAPVQVAPGQELLTGSAPALGGDPTIDEFVVRWGLDTTSREALIKLEPAMRNKIMTDFAPQNLAKSNQMFMSFVRGVVSRMSSPPQNSTNFGHAAQATGDPLVDDFIRQWNLDSQALEVLCRLDPATQQKVITDFRPADPLRANRIFMSFVRSVAGRTGAAAAVAALPPEPVSMAFATGHRAIDEFLAKWGLDSKSQQVLLSLDPAMQERVISSFAPPNAARANPMFMGFVKSLAGNALNARRATPY